MFDAAHFLSDLQEVITNEHVVAMMKAAINETEAVPPFVSLLSNQSALHCHVTGAAGPCVYVMFSVAQEPKMTRSKFKEVVEKGVVRLCRLYSVCSLIPVLSNIWIRKYQTAS